MPDPAERFIDAATAPLAENAELQVMARRELEEAISTAGPGNGDSLAEAAEQLESAGRRPHSKWWTLTLYAVTGILSVGILANSVMSVLQFRQTTGAISLFGIMGSGGDPESLDKYLGRNLTPEQKLLLLGDRRQSGRANQMKGLWESEPENPAYFADYTTAHLSEHSALPPDFLETATRIDPDNAWFIAMAAADSARASIDQRARAATSPGGLKIKAIKDPAKLVEALDLMRQAASRKRFDSYQTALLRQRIPLLPKRTDWMDQMVPIAYTAGLTVPSMRLKSLSDAVSAEAIRLAQDKDPEGLKRLIADWRSFAEIYAPSEPTFLVDALVAIVLTRGPLKAFHEAATDLGLAEEAAWAKALDDRFEEWRTATKAHADPNKDMALRSSLLGGLTFPSVSSQSRRSPVLQPADLEPGRLADHAFAGRIQSLAGWSLLGLVSLAAGLYRFRGSLLTRRLSAQLAVLPRPVDWAWIFGIGILLPLLYHFAIIRFTPLGGREWSLKASAFMLPAGQFSAMICMMVLLPVMIVRQRLARRGAALGWTGKRQIPGWIAVVSAAVSLPAFGLAFTGDKPTGTSFVVAGSLLLPPLLYLLVIGLRALFSGQAGLLRRVTVSRVLLPAYATGMLLMMLLVPLFHAEERHWIALDRLTQVTPEKPGIGPYEWEIAQSMREELLEILEMK